MRLAIAASLIAAGCGDDLPAPSCAATHWSAAPPMPTAVQETAVVALDNKVYVIGGFDAAIQILDTVEVFDIASQTWSLGPPLPMPIHHANAAVVGDTIYVLGALRTGAFVATGAVFAWNPKTDADWTTKTSMPDGVERGAAVAGAIGDAVYIAGGLRNQSVATLASYSTSTDTWSVDLPPVPQPFDHACGGVVGGKLYVLGGRFMGNTPLVFEYTPGGAWAQKAPMPTARSGTACGICGDEIIVAGGELNPNNVDSVFADVELYDTRADVWLPMPAIPTPRHGFGGAVVGNEFYLPGGATKTGFAAVATHEVLQP